MFKRSRASQNSPHDDRRGATRAPVDLLINRFVNGYPYLCRATDISRTGMRVVPLLQPTAAPRPRFMGLQFQLPGMDEVVTASGEAIFASEGCGPVGIRFTKLPAASAQLIDRFLGTPRAA